MTHLNRILTKHKALAPTRKFTKRPRARARGSDNESRLAGCLGVMILITIVHGISSTREPRARAHKDGKRPQIVECRATESCPHVLRDVQGLIPVLKMGIAQFDKQMRLAYRKMK
jgi:hypothetical protein